MAAQLVGTAAHVATRSHTVFRVVAERSLTHPRYSRVSLGAVAIG